jgi:hypothetical protein
LWYILDKITIKIIMTIQEKLKSYKDKINGATELNDGIKNLISIELFDYLHTNTALKAEFFRRTNYFSNLSKDKKFIDIQEGLFNAINKVLGLTNIKEIDKLQQDLNKEHGGNEYRLIDKLRHKQKISSDYALNLTDTYKALQDKDNYFRLGVRGGSTYGTEISYFIQTVQVNEQYKMFEHLIGLIRLNIMVLDDNLHKKFDEALEEYNKAWYEFNELIYKTPIKLHTRSFEEFVLFCSVSTPIEGYETYYNLRGLQTDKLSDVKRFSTVVLDDLTEFSDTQTENSLPQKYLNPVVQAEEAARKKMQDFGEQLDESFAKDKQNIQISRAWFEAISNSLKPQVEAYQTYVAQTLINLEPFRRRLEENAKIISNISERMIMPNLEAIRPMLTEIEKSLNSVSKFYVPPQKLTITAPLPPRMSETIQRNEIIKEIKTLRHRVEELTTTKPAIAPKEPVEGRAADKLPETFEIKVKDREIWVNNFLLSKPHGVGTNFETFDAIRGKVANTPIKKTDLQDWLQKEIGSGSLADILYQLGFTGEILKAFFPKRSKKGIIVYSGDKITKKDLDERGIKISIFLKQLELAHLKNHPE